MAEPEPIKAPYIPYESACSQAQALLSEHGFADAIPVDVEVLAERAGLDIVPMHNLEADFKIHGFLTGTLDEIRVDQATWE